MSRRYVVQLDENRLHVWKKFIKVLLKYSIQAKSESRNNSKICLHPVRKDDRLNRSNERCDNKKNKNGGILD